MPGDPVFYKYTRSPVLLNNLDNEAKIFNRMAQQCYMQVLNKNGQVHNNFTESTFCIEHICKGGFRFLTKENFELEDRVQVQLRFPDHYSQKVYGRICYSDTIDEELKVYGFSVINGFYSGVHIKDCA